MAKAATGYSDLHELKIRVHEDVNGAIDEDVEAMGGGRGVKGSVVRAALGLWLAIPKPMRRSMLHPWLSTAPESRINAQLDGLWPTRMIRAAARINDADRELIIESLERSKSARALVRELEKRQS